jgi:hypothetical protein
MKQEPSIHDAPKRRRRKKNATPSLRAVVAQQQAAPQPTPAHAENPTPPRAARGENWMLVVSLATAGAVAASVFLALALIGYGTGWWVTSIVFFLASAITVLGAHRHIRPAVLAVCGVVVLLSCTGAVVGGLTTELVNGVPVAKGSPQARTRSDVNTIDAYLRTLQRVDELLVLDEATARARQEEISAMRSQARDMASATAQRRGASELLTEAYGCITRAADSAFVALDGKLQLAAQFDTRIADEVEAARSTFISEALRAGQLTRQAASLAGIPIGVME